MYRAWCFATLLIACGGNDDAAPDAPSPDAAPVPTALVLRFDRPAGGQAFDAIATWLDAGGAPVAGDAIAIAIDSGTAGAPSTSGTETRVRVTPDGTGRIAVTATSGAATVARTALVLATVDDAWNQPEVVRGLVNTAGWEDGPSVSPDGQTLVLQYLPVPIDCIAGHSAASPACKIIGPVAAPERPGLPGASRVLADGTFHNGCPAAGLDPLPDSVVVPPNAEWAFTRSADGSFVDPRPIYYDGIDGCISAFGLAIAADNHTIMWAIDDPLPPDDGPKIRSASLALSNPTALGTYSIAGGQLTLSSHAGMQLPLGESLGEGNPYIAVRADGRRIAFFDDEGGRQDLLFAEETAAGSSAWGAVGTIPAPVSASDAQESQPFLDGQTLLFRRDLTLLASDWSGGALDVASSWSAPRTVLAPGGVIAAVGEPSVATVGGARELYFVFAEQLADHLNLDVAVVPAR